jgi:glycerol uptake operon antiterminator
MLTQSRISLLDLPPQCRTIPVIEDRVQFAHAFDAPQVSAIILRHCNLFEFATLLERAHRRGLSVYVNIDHIEGIHADAAGLNHLAHHFHVSGIISSNPRTLALARPCGLQTIQRIFAADSAGLETALESVDTHHVDLLDIAPALVIPHLIRSLEIRLPLPFIASGLIYTHQQVQDVLRAGALAVTVRFGELYDTGSWHSSLHLDPRAGRDASAG